MIRTGPEKALLTANTISSTTARQILAELP
jgi:hypothetical protein